jgi:hypothetical protein
MTLGDQLRGELAPTKSYTGREWQWLPAEWPYEDGRDGTLVIGVTTDGKRRVRTEFFYYAVQFVWTECDPVGGIWTFLLENEREPDEGGPFRCVVGGMVEECGCEAGCMDRARVQPTGCKHRDALSAITREVM